MSSNKRPSPSSSATLFKVGTKKIGNDGKKWEVCTISNGTHRWKQIADKKILKATGAKKKKAVVSKKKSTNVKKTTRKVNNVRWKTEWFFVRPSKGGGDYTTVMRYNKNMVEVYDSKREEIFIDDDFNKIRPEAYSNLVFKSKYTKKWRVKSEEGRAFLFKVGACKYLFIHASGELARMECYVFHTKSEVTNLKRGYGAWNLPFVVDKTHTYMLTTYTKYSVPSKSVSNNDPYDYYSQPPRGTKKTWIKQFTALDAVNLF